MVLRLGWAILGLGSFVDLWWTVAFMGLGMVSWFRGAVLGFRFAVALESFEPFVEVMVAVSSFGVVEIASFKFIVEINRGQGG